MVVNKRNNKRIGYLLIGSLIFVFLFILIIFPLVSVLSRSFRDNATGVFTFDNYYLAFHGNNIKTILNTLNLAFWVSLVSSVIAFPVALILSKTKLRKFWWISIIMMIPFMIPPYINSLGWMLFMQKNGILWRLNKCFRPLAKSFYSFPGMVWIMSMHTYPFLTTMLISAFNTIPSNIDDATIVYCKSKVLKYIKVYLPILLPNYLIGAFLVFVKAMSEYGTPATFGVRINYDVLTTTITNYMQVSPINFSVAASLASVLVTICMILWIFQTFIVEKKSYGLLSDDKPKINSNNTIMIIGAVFLLVVFFFSAFIPLGTIVISSFKKINYFNLSAPNNFTLDNYKNGFMTNSGFGTGWEALKNTLYVSFFSSALVLLLGVVFGIYCRRNRKKKIGKSVELLATLPQMIPNVVTGIGLIIFYNTIYKYLPLYRTKWMLILGYVIILLPQSYSYVKNSLIQLPNSLLEAGEIFGKNIIYNDLRIVFPVAIKGAVLGFVMTFIVSFRELMMAKLLQPAAFYTISLFIDSQFDQGNQQVAMAVTVVSVAITLIVLLPIKFMNRSKKGNSK